MKDFIGFSQEIVFINQGHIRPPPVPDPDPPTPAPTGPLNILIASDTGLNGSTAEFTPTTGNAIVRIFGRKNASGAGPAVSVSATQGGAPVALTKILEYSSTAAGTSFVFAAGIRGLTPGQNCTLTFATTSAAGRCAVRIGELAAMPADWAAPSYTKQMDNDSADGAIDNYYMECSPDIPAGYLVLSIAGWLNSGAYPIDSSGDDEMWSTRQGSGTGGMAAYFGQTPSPGGEPGWGGYVYYANNAVTKPNGALFAIKGGTLP